MAKKITVADIPASIGQEVGCSGWRVVTQGMINQFADATDDHQFIHVDPERAKETPFGGTIAHGFLTLSLLSTLAYEVLPELEGQIFGINYGFDKVRFMAPVKSGARVRARFIVSQAEIRPSGRIVFHYAVTLEIENSKKPALIADWITIAMVAPEDA
ncbi:MAG: MaoC-like domain-containing protein [Candidatus Tokpelaia hoelldobleri]|uniref:MaoC-like domain-containing protein n=1 Tax=Candidatus Tokpelaia hoelldobleri TaxID=1902579 RepID=A0A1U9JW49_9HYPH|nr:MAG: MaoC-like domain-containing protein [Candidatus Tokpelaia hoelldoblerii]